MMSSSMNIKSRRETMTLSSPCRRISSILLFVALLLVLSGGHARTIGDGETKTTTTTTTTGTPRKETASFVIPEELCGPFGSYPNVLNISDVERQGFHPVVRLPSTKRQQQHKQQQRLPITDNSNRSSMGSPDDIQAAIKRKAWKRWWHRVTSKPPLLLFGLSAEWSIGKYDENRVAMYTSELFEDTDNKIDGYGGQRTVHLGVDIGAPVGTKVYAFSDGIIHSCGYNADHGDYGYVVVIEHLLPVSNRSVWALYGHLSKDTICSLGGKTVGSLVAKGKMIGRIGDCHENGGWKEPHVHFQLSVTPPDTHDMPGACSVEDRGRALLNYPDPRYVLGPVH